MIRAKDRNNLDGKNGRTAVRIGWPYGLSTKQKQVAAYWDSAMEPVEIFLYMGKYIITDESGYLTEYRGKKYACGGPIRVCSTEEEVKKWMNDSYEDLKAEGEI